MFRALFLTIMVCFVANAAEEKHLPVVYEDLGLRPGATSAEIAAAYAKKIAEKISPAERARVEVAHAVLSTPELKAQVDAGKTDLTIKVPENARKDIVELAERFDKPAADHLRRYGTISARTLSTMITFYFAVGVAEGTKCFIENDPMACKSYAEGLKEPAGHIGFLLFMGVASGVSRVSGKVFAPRAASYLGLAYGAFANDVFIEIYHNPHAAEFRKAAEIKNPEMRKKKRDEAIRKLAEDTYKNSDWWKERAPSIAGLLAASAAAEFTFHGGELALKRARPFLERHLGCASLLAMLGDGLATKGVRAFATRRAAEVGSILVFLGWSGVTNPVAHTAWDKLTLEREIEKLQKQMRAPEALSSAEIAGILKERGLLMEKWHRRQMGDVQKIMSSHQENLFKMDEAERRPLFFYEWFVSGFNKSGTAWQALQGEYGGGGDLDPEDLAEDTNRYLRSFFCGPKPEDAYREEVSILGLPVPGRFHSEVEPYRVAERDPNLCRGDTPPERFREAILNGDFRENLNSAYAAVKKQAEATREKNIANYESRVSRSIAEILEKKVLPAFAAEIGDLEVMRSKVQGATEKKLIAERIGEVTEQAESAKKLLVYMTTPPEKRTPPGIDLDDLLGQLNPDEEPEWRKVVRYFNGFVLE